MITLPDAAVRVYAKTLTNMLLTLMITEGLRGKSVEVAEELCLDYMLPAYDLIVARCEKYHEVLGG